MSLSIFLKEIQQIDTLATKAKHLALSVKANNPPIKALISSLVSTESVTVYLLQQYRSNHEKYDLENKAHLDNIVFLGSIIEGSITALKLYLEQNSWNKLTKNGHFEKSFYQLAEKIEVFSQGLIKIPTLEKKVAKDAIRVPMLTVDFPGFSLTPEGFSSTREPTLSQYFSSAPLNINLSGMISPENNYNVSTNGYLVEKTTEKSENESPPTPKTLPPSPIVAKCRVFTFDPNLDYQSLFESKKTFDLMQHDRILQEYSTFREKRTSSHSTNSSSSGSTFLYDSDETDCSVEVFPIQRFSFNTDS